VYLQICIFSYIPGKRVKARGMGKVNLVEDIDDLLLLGTILFYGV